MIANLATAFRFARRELRSGLQGFSIFLACLTLGVAAIAVVGALSASIARGIAEKGQVLMGGDLELTILHHQPDAAQLAFVQRLGRSSKVATLRAMAAAGADRSVLVEVKVVDDAYPLYGELTLRPATTAADALARQPSGRFGTAVEEALLARIGLEQGDTVRIGTAEFDITAVITHEPDRISDGFVLGPRALIDEDALDGTGLVRPGSLITWRHRVALEPPVTPATVKQATRAAEEELAGAGWRVRSSENAAPGVRRFIDRLTFFLSLVGVTALIVGGVGVANAVTAFIERHGRNIATLKCLGASAGLVFWTYLVEVLLVATLAIATGCAIGLATPAVAAYALAGILPVPVAAGVEIAPVLRAALFGYLIVLAFSVWPLARAGRIPATALFRDMVAHTRAKPGLRPLVVIALSIVAIFALTAATIPDPRITWGYAAGIAASFAILAALARLLMWWARWVRPARSAVARLAISNLHRPGAPTPSVVMSLGLGLTLFVTLAVIDANVSKELRDNLPERAPAFFFLDVHSSEADAFVDRLQRAGAGDVGTAPMLRGRITAVDGVPAAEVEPDPGAAWALRGDRGITYAATPPANARLVAGSWWPQDHAGKPLVSFSQDIAEGLDLDIGDTVTVNVLGREITAEIANLRAIDWGSLQINFVMVFSPNTFAGAPHMYVLTAQADRTRELSILRDVSAAFPTVTAIRVRDALDAVNDLMARLLAAIRGANAITLFVGVLVLAGALATGLSRRIYDAVVLKTYGATRRQLLRALVIEYAILGTATALFAIAAGTGAAWAIISFVMQIEWRFPLLLAVLTAFASMGITVAAGLVTTWSALKARPAQVLRVD